MNPINFQDLIKHQYKDASNLEARISLHQKFSINKQGMHPWLAEQLGLSNGQKILEMGCGPGTFWQEAEAQLRGLTPILTDFSVGMVDKARQSLAARYPGMDFLVANIQSIPFPKNTFDIVMAHFMLYHVPDRPTAFREVVRVLKPEGIFYAMTVGDNHLVDLYALVEGFAPELNQVFSVPFTVQNGGDQLAAFFEQVDYIAYEDALVVTEAQPIIAYVLSTLRWEVLRQYQERLPDFALHIEKTLAEKGPITIRKESGLFRCSGAKTAGF